ncbi:putative protein-export membrane protein SecG [bioreactor metagenome]|uniref:Protein-export membrane protein SecG n=1 Tax=bioreactor metagenome TaxID=1076179 RepID=A0A645FTB6_9ZZZZ
MSTYQIVLASLLIVSAIIIIVVVLLQESKTAGLSGAIAGGADTFFGKNKGRTIEAKLEKWTKYVAIFFFIVSIVTTFLMLFLS